MLAVVDSRNGAGGPSEAAHPGASLVLSAEGDSLAFTVPKSCVAWRVDDGALAFTCAQARWPKLIGPVTLSLVERRAHVPRRRADPDWAGLPPPNGQYYLQARAALQLARHAGNVEAYCENLWLYCTKVRVDGDLFGTRTELRFSATTWDGVTAVALGRAILSASTLTEGGS